MKNLTTSQQAIINNLKSEFNLINNTNNNKGSGLIDVQTIMSEVNKTIQAKEEIKISNEVWSNLLEETINNDVLAIKHDIESLGFEVLIRGRQIIIHYKDKTFKALRLDYVLNSFYNELGVKEYNGIKRQFEKYNWNKQECSNIEEWTKDCEFIDKLKALYEYSQK